LEQEIKLKKEIHTEFTSIKKRVEMVQKHEEEVVQIKKKNDWLSA